MQNQTKLTQINKQYDDCISKINQLNDHLKILAGEHQLQSLEEMVVPDEYLQLLANSLYAANSMAFCYANIKNIPMPAQFGKVQELYKMAKNPLQTHKPSQPSVVINKEAAKRVINSALQQQ